MSTSTLPTHIDRWWLPVVRVRGQSMTPGLHEGQLTVTRPRLGNVRKGAVIVLARDGHRFVKRVVGTGGDVVELESGHLRVNGRWLDGRDHPAGAYVARWLVPDGLYFVAGDNEEASDDSRVWSEPFVTPHQVLGVVVGRRKPVCGAA